MRDERDIAAPGGCPLCWATEVSSFAHVHGRLYLDCPECGLIHLSPSDRLSPAAERAHYGTHENDPTDPGYRTFLAQVVNPLVERLEPGAEGLDFGAGPGPTVSLMLKERGFSTWVYDPFFAPDPVPLARRYDFITCTETVEHFFFPAEEFRRLNGLLRPGGWLAVMTEVADDARPFGEWRYARDPTHACFYRARTLDWLAAKFGWRLERPSRNVALFRKP